MILTKKYSPMKFSEVYGQKQACTILKGLLKNPEKSQRVINLYGDFGVGKTSLARIFARTLNCELGKSNPCGKCDSCKTLINRASYYQEYDCGMVGNVDSIREVKSQLLYTASAVKWQVVVFDEFHMASVAAQGAIIKALDELDSHTFVIFCTTDFERMVGAIRSRSVNIPLIPLSKESGEHLIASIVKREKATITSAAQRYILASCYGHARDILMQMDLYFLLGEEEFFDGIVEYEKIFLGMLYLIKTGDKEKYERGLQKLSSGLLRNLRRVFFSTLDEGLKTLLLNHTESIYAQQYLVLCKVWRYELIKLFEYSVSEWGNRSFENDLMFQCFMRSLFLKFKK
jgi:DNA polymerase III subunit gamma/tau